MADSDMVGLFRKELELCKVKAGERIGILSEDQIRADYAAAFLVAAEELGADPFHVNIRKRPGSFFGPGNSLRGRQAAIDALKGADMVIDLIGLLWSNEQTEITNAGPRMLLVLEPVEVLSRMLPSAESRRRVEAASRVLKGARSMHITSRGGTDVTYRLGNMRTISQYGYTDEPGRWDAWPGAFVWTGADNDGVDGTVVIDAGDMLLPFRRYASSPIALTIKAGYITDIQGGGTEGLMMRDIMRSFNDPKAYAVSHIGWGLDEKADWSFIGTHPASPLSQGQDGRAFYGNVMFSTGPNTEIGGTNHTDCHLDIPLRNCSLFLDGEPIVKHGVVLPDAMRVPGR
ncbi:leucyl aminopeptidase [Lichenifustis flavocetrariae]|uniref:Leucyl aminopeptidase n=1 Tax=Lichenifustis flavocetrariae TaxID=2949735 RepID=A0AA41YZN2_9HYPH|nr:leucyl aminopeptidase [Lichenifustis flavocetrariae]MCW6507838.1 leucyl aminopeptidase [Lichenifustis flavocetrariae]